MTNVLLYTRPYARDLFLKMIEFSIGASRITSISEFSKTADVWVGDYVYDDLYDVRELPDEEIEDIICRDRFLRETDRRRAIRIVNRFWNGCEQLFRKSKFDYLVSLTCDCFYPDILFRIARRYGVPIISPVGTFLAGEYARFTLYGERIDLNREVSEAEVLGVLEKICAKSFLPKTETKHMQRSSLDVLMFYMRRKFIENIYHPIQRIVTADPDNQRWNTSLFKGVRFSDLYSTNYDSCFTPIEDIDFYSMKTAYLPMHLIPEASTDYFCKSIAAEGYCDYVLRVAGEKHPGILLLVKEHPAMFGKRKLQFYKDLATIPEVRVIHPLVRSNEILDRVDLVVVDNGTVGIEAAVRGKNVLALEDNYYSDLSDSIHVNGMIDAQAFNMNRKKDDSFEFIKKLLSSMFPSDFSDIGKGTNDKDAQLLASGVRLLLERL